MGAPYTKGPQIVWIVVQIYTWLKSYLDIYQLLKFKCQLLNFNRITVYSSADFYNIKRYQTYHNTNIHIN